MDLYPTLRPILFKMDSESAHQLTLFVGKLSQKFGLLNLLYQRHQNPINVMGLEFSNPVGLAAGFDKNGEYIALLSALGFGFIEIGTITPKSQAGNKKPRLFRLEDHRAIINRMGFNNKGVDVLLENLREATSRPIVGVNIGANKDSVGENRIEDYLHCLGKVFTDADYIAVNISSPNTPGLRDLQHGDELSCLLKELRLKWLKLRDQTKKEPPLVLKIAPDLLDEDIRSLADLLMENEIDGVIATNTTISRSNLSGHFNSAQVGGLSGEPLLARSLEVIKILHKRLDGTIPIIGCGGIMSGSDAVEFQNAGAACVQIYSGMIYRGPNLIAECVKNWKK